MARAEEKYPRALRPCLVDKKKTFKYRIITNEQVGKTIKRKTMQRVQYLSSVGEIGWGSLDLPWAMRLHFSLKQTLGKKKKHNYPTNKHSVQEKHTFPTNKNTSTTQKTITKTNTSDKQTLTKKKTRFSNNKKLGKKKNKFRRSKIFHSNKKHTSSKNKLRKKTTLFLQTLRKKENYKK